MAKPLVKQLLKNTAIYAGSNILQIAVPFFLIPIFTRFLTPEDYGTIATFYSAVAVFTVIVGLQVSAAITVHYFDLTREAVARWSGDAFKIVGVSTLCWFLLALFFKEPLSEKFKIASWVILLIPLVAMTNTLYQTYLARLRVGHLAYQFGLSNIGRMLIDMAISVTLVVGLSWHWQGRIWGIVSGSILAAIVGIFYLAATQNLVFTRQNNYGRGILKFSLPMIPHALGGWVLALSDRLLLPFFTNLHDTGLYNVGYSFGQALMFVTSAVNQAWHPSLYQVWLNDPPTNRLIIKRTFQYKAVILVGGLATIFLMPKLLVLVVGEKFHASAQFVPWIAGGYIFEALRSTTMPYIAFAKRTHYLATIMLITTIINLGLNLWLIPKYGAMAAAWSTLIAYIFSYLFTLYAAFRCRGSFPTQTSEGIAK